MALIVNPISSLVARLKPRQRMALPFVRSALAQGVSGNKIQKMLTDMGAGMQRSRIQEIVRYYRDRTLKDEMITAGSHARIADVNNVPFSEFRQKKKLNYTVTYSAIDEATGEAISQHVTIVTNRTNLKLSTIEAKATELLEADNENYPFTVENVTVSGITKRDDV